VFDQGAQLFLRLLRKCLLEAWPVLLGVWVLLENAACQLLGFLLLVTPATNIIGLFGGGPSARE
jgi:hypothetical protein